MKVKRNAASARYRSLFGATLGFGGVVARHQPRSSGSGRIRGDDRIFRTGWRHVETMAADLGRGIHPGRNW